MNYILLFKKSLWILRSEKAIWTCVFLSGLVSILSAIETRFIRGNVLLLCVSFFISFSSLYLSIVAMATLVVLVQRISMNQRITFREGWHLAHKKFFSLLGGTCLVSALLVILFVGFSILLFRSILAWNPWFVVLGMVLFIPLLSLIDCTIMIDDLPVLPAFRKGISVFIQNFHRFLIITGAAYLVSWLGTILLVALYSSVFRYDFPVLSLFNLAKFVSMQTNPVVYIPTWIMNLGAFSLTEIAVTLSYLQFTRLPQYTVLEKQRMAGQDDLRSPEADNLPR